MKNQCGNRWKNSAAARFRKAPSRSRSLSITSSSESSSTSGDDLLDPSLALIAAERGTRDAGYWVERLAAPEIARGVSEGVIDRLIERGVLERDDGGLLSVTSRVSRTRRYPGVSGPDGRDAGLRIMGVIFADEVPHPREVMLIAIVNGLTGSPDPRSLRASGNG